MNALMGTLYNTPTEWLVVLGFLALTLALWALEVWRRKRK